MCRGEELLVQRRAFAATHGLVLKIANEVLVSLNIAGELPVRGCC
jgi:hypothetical protein